MNTIIYPTTYNGSINAIGSKSMTHRALFLSLFQKQVIINNANISEDIFETINILKTLGANIIINDTTIIVKGIEEIKNNLSFKIKYSATSLRFLIPVLKLLKINSTITISESLRKRLQNSDFKDFSIDYEIKENKLIIKNDYQLNNFYLLDFHNSSQVISGFLIGLSYFNNNVTLQIKKPLDSYILLTINMLKEFNQIIEHSVDEEYETFKIHNRINQNIEYLVDGDFSNSAYLLALGIKGNVEINHLNTNSKQPDAKIIDFLKKANCHISIINNKVILKQSELTPFNVDLKFNPDLAPLLMALSATMPYESHFQNIKRLIHKESNRLVEVCKILKSLGAIIKLDDNELTITGPTKFNDCLEFDSKNDHRLVFMLIVLANFINKPIKILNSEAVNKSYPTYFDDLAQLKGKFSHENNSI